MIKDFYIRSENDPYYRDNIVETRTETDALVNQIKITLGTTPTFVLGEPRFGISLEQYLFQFDINADSISVEINEQINNFSELASIYNIKMDVKKVKTPDNKTALLADMQIDGKNILGFLV